MGRAILGMILSLLGIGGNLSSEVHAETVRYQDLTVTYEGQLIKITAQTNPSTGFDYKVKDYDATAVSVLPASYYMDEKDRELDGASSLGTYPVKILKPGNTSFIFSYLRDCGKEVFIAIDEFQTICDYPEKGTEALLRSYIQFIHNIHFIFSGSKQHLMYEMFGSPKRPFYQSTAIMSLDPLHEEIYYDFAAHFFSNKGGSLSEQVFHSLYQRFSGHTWYMQSVLNRLYERERNVTEEQQVKDAIQVILADKTDQYSMLMTFLSDNQRRLLKALATEGVVVQPLSNAFIQKYELPSSSSVKKALTVLVDKDLVYHATEGYVVYDRFFDLWLRRL